MAQMSKQEPSPAPGKENTAGTGAGPRAGFADPG